ncbi:FAD-linked oxidoreductase-like protein [Thelonectria olida]|uniref:Proline dehydrogenase n=1 Tax=Thelonectria olida TaxID=1576542 RepID=A0A9P9ARZ8_9HYPO|nr:FAD-linked oxidoreductase-like protein [Thelonectria olida]
MLFMARQRVCLAARRFPSAIAQRTIRSTSSTSTSTSAASSAILRHVAFKDRRVVYAAGGTTVAIIGLLLVKRDGETYPDDPRDVKALSTVPFGKLLSGWTAFAFCSSPTWVDMSEALYNIVSEIPVLSSLTHAFVMRTFFNQFLGGETTGDCIPKIEALRKEQIGTLLGYNIEAELDGSSKDPQLILEQTQHVLSSIEAQGKLAKKYCPDTSATGGDNRSWVRIKVTGLLPHPVALHHGSNAILKAREEKGLDKDVPYPGLPHDGDWEAALSGKSVTESDREQLISLRAVLEAIASKARDNKVRIVIDAEQSWYQPVIDCLTDELMQKYNTLGGPATCIASFQAYLRRYPQLLDQQLRRAEEKGYKLLFKQIRGAYMVSEAERWKKEGRQGPGPVWPTKAETDKSFNYGMEKTLSTVADQVRESGHSKLGAVFATHNSISIDLGIQLLEKHGLACRKTVDGTLLVPNEVAGSIAFAQLYGKLSSLRDYLGLL